MSQKPFIVDTKATMLKKHRNLTKHARQLYLTMRALADGKTGELRINGRWLKASVFDASAEMCRDLRMSAMRELIAVGLVTLKRARVCRLIDGRRRSVLGETQYTVHREPVLKDHHEAKDSSKVDLVKSISSTVVEIDSQFIPEIPTGMRGELVFGFSGAEEEEEGSSHHHQGDEDDGARPSSFQTRNHVNPIEKGTVEERTRTKNIPSVLRSWMDTRILARAHEPVNSRRAYLLASRPAFLEYMADEIEQFLTEKAEEFMRQRIEEASVVKYEEVFNLLVAQTKKHELPVGIDGDEREPPFVVFERIFDNASEILGLQNCDESDEK